MFEDRTLRTYVRTMKWPFFMSGFDRRRLTHLTMWIALSVALCVVFDVVINLISAAPTNYVGDEATCI